MKKLLYLLMVALCATMFTACSDDDDKDPMNEEEGGEGVITMVTEGDYIDVLVFSFNEGDIITIDWGDGTIQEYKTVLYKYYDEEEYPETIRYGTDESEHEYSNDNPHTITIKGNISGLWCMYNLTSLDVSKNTKLTYLDCANNNLTSLDVSKNTALTELWCESNNLSSLDVSKNTALTKLWCESNNLSSLDVSKNTALTKLRCYGNELTSLDVSKNTALTELGCESNNLSSLDVSKNTALTRLGCESNNLSSLDVSGCTALTELDCGRNNLSSSSLNKIFGDLPQGRELDDYLFPSRIAIGDNPGTNTCDRSIAENKGWKVSD